MQATAQHTGRPHDAEASRTAILDAAEEHFANAGFAGARVDAIAATAGYNKSLIFQYFGDKLGLYRAVLSRLHGQSDRQFMAMAAPLAGSDSALDAQRVRTLIEATVRWTFDHDLAHPKLVRILAWEAADGWRTFIRLAAERPKEEQMAWAEGVRAFTGRAQQAGLIRPDLDPIIVLTSVMGMTLHYLTTAPRFAEAFPEAHLTSPAAMRHAREQIVALAVHGTMLPAAIVATSNTTATPLSVTSSP